MFARVASSHGATQAQVAIAWLLYRSPAIVPLPGTCPVRHLEENMLGGYFGSIRGTFKTWKLNRATKDPG